MIERLKQQANRLSFRQQLTFAFALGITALALLSSLVISSITERRLHQLLLQQGFTVTDSFADQSTLALLYQSVDTARDVSQPVINFPGVSGVRILTADGQELYQEGEPTQTADELPPSPTMSETNYAWFFHQPIYADSESTDGQSPFNVQETEPELLGYVQVTMSKKLLSTTSRSILRSNLLTGLVVAGILFVVLLTITNRVTRPIRNLSSIMKRAEQGETNLRVTPAGSADVVRMEQAFNTMMTTLESREEELKRARDTALTSARIKGEFATTVSHELRTPMNGVMGMLELLRSMDVNEEQLEYINVARSSGEELLLLIDDILDFSKIESGKLKLHRSSFEPRDLVKGITELLSPQAQQKQLAITCEVEPSVPENLVSDPSRIRQILINLIGNAIKFTHQGHIHINVSTQPGKDENHPELLVKIKDTGIGIAKNAQQLIFEAFSQADSSTTRQFGGTGLGLAICNQLVKLLGGDIGVNSELGKGSEFWFQLPVSLSQGTEQQVHIPDELVGTRVLIVSRTVDSCHSLINTFIAWECFLRTTTTLNETLILLRSGAIQGKPYDYVIVDSPLAEGNELELIETVGNDPHLANTRMVLLSHTPQYNLPGKAVNLGKSPSAEQLEKTLLTLHRAPERDNAASAKPQIEGALEGHVLVVEDNRTNQLVAEGMLQKLGCTCDIADNGNAAITALENKNYDLVLMDCNMPFMNGYTASQLIRGKPSSYQNIPIIALTANAAPFDLNRCIAAGMNDYLSKPLSLEILEPKLRNWLVQGATARTQDQQPPVPAITNRREEESPSLDSDVLENLQLQVGQSFQKFINAYLEDTPIYIKNLAQAAKQQDEDQIKYFIHIIKGSSSNLGLVRLVEYCGQYELIANTASSDDKLQLVEDLHHEFHYVKELLKAYLEENLTKQKDGISLDFKPHILIVDDDNSSRIIMRSVLEKDGYTISEATNGAEAIKRCQQAMPDLILMDAMMPVMDGFVASERIMAMDSDSYPTILIITALQDEGTLERAFAAGATDFIVKPINMTVLRQRVSRVLHAGHIDRHIHQLAYYDNLTSLPNRTFFIERSRKLLINAQEHKTNVAVLFLDIDRFKFINDSQNHDIGDGLLKEFAKRLEGCIRTADLVARLGGDEFTIVLNQVRSKEDVITAANKVLDVMKEPFYIMDSQLYVSSSIGIALYPDDGETITSLMKHADTAMFHAKSRGGASYEFYQEGMESDITKQVELEVELRNALDNDEFVLYYQPQINLTSGRLSGLEALIRWQHPTRGFIPPIEFIPFAEKSGLINLIGDWVLRKACEQQRQWLDRGFDPVPIAVNVSGRELSDSVLLSKVKKALEDTQVPPKLIKLEITEDTLAGCNDTTTEHLNNLRNLGTTLAIDDFGTGYSSLSYLKMFPVDTLKIDRSFVKDLPDDANSAAIISGIIALGHSLNMLVIAEGVETAEQQEFLRKEGCDVMQGYYLSKPLPLDTLENWIVENQVHSGFILPTKSARQK